MPQTTGAGEDIIQIKMQRIMGYLWIFLINIKSTKKKRTIPS
jgi:hypothetical protein